MSAEPEDTADEEGLVCPYCQKMDRDAWEMAKDADSGETECIHCNREFRWSTYTSITYFGYPIRKEGA